MAAPRSAPISILFVDDEPAVLRVIARLLGRLPFEILTAGTPGEALQILDTRPVDVLVSDIDMPEMDGLELLQIVRRDHPLVVRMLLTGTATLDRALHAINQGEVTRFFTKPFEVELFRDAMESLAERIDRLRREETEVSRRARRLELQEWLDRRYPGVLDVERTADDELVIDLEQLTAAVEAAASPTARNLLHREV